MPSFENPKILFSSTRVKENSQFANLDLICPGSVLMYVFTKISKGLRNSNVGRMYIGAVRLINGPQPDS